MSSHWRYIFMAEQRKKTATLNLRIDPELKETAERAAADDQRSLTSLVEKLLSDHLKANGYLGGTATGTLSNEPHLATAETPGSAKKT
ncbi:toxin-antitoxin system HicB family antitoxin [Methylobacterium flocculans]|uniref:toxin-antitoxin system HicB family antitoxin n=1 Tax=Methylobacterium flocculans TaxID=2984843 RepID=UPI0021F30977|nr:hypothetical protein [Methylobacterium sp. FF17]